MGTITLRNYNALELGYNIIVENTMSKKDAILIASRAVAFYRLGFSSPASSSQSCLRWPSAERA